MTLIGSIRKGDGKGGDKDKAAEKDQKLFAYASDRLISMNKLSDLELQMAELERMQKRIDPNPRAACGLHCRAERGGRQRFMTAQSRPTN